MIRTIARVLGRDSAKLNARNRDRTQRLADLSLPHAHPADEYTTARYGDADPEEEAAEIARHDEGDER